jgi:hypothetical protein
MSEDKIDKYIKSYFMIYALILGDEKALQMIKMIRRPISEEADKHE